MMTTMDPSSSELSFSDAGAPDSSGSETGASHTGASDAGAADTNATDSPAVDANSSDTDSFTGSALNGSPRPPLVGAAVRLRQALPYLKTADPMPMLRPPDLIDPGELGQVMALRPLDQRAVRFRRGTFLLAAADLELVAGEES
jgi:hypothetical protein